MERIGREVIKARGLTVDHEISNHRAHKSAEEARVLFRATERTEREIMDNLEANLSLKGWTISTLIHDEIFIHHPIEHTCLQNLSETLLEDATLVGRSFEEAKSWAPGTLGPKVTPY